MLLNYFVFISIVCFKFSCCVNLYMNCFVSILSVLRISILNGDIYVVVFCLAFCLIFRYIVVQVKAFFCSYDSSLAFQIRDLFPFACVPSNYHSYGKRSMCSLIMA